MFWSLILAHFCLGIRWKWSCSVVMRRRVIRIAFGIADRALTNMYLDAVSTSVIRWSFPRRDVGRMSPQESDESAGV